MTSVRAIRLAASTWTPRGQGDAPTAAALLIDVEVVGDTVRLVPDLARYLSDTLPWPGVEYGVDVVPADTLPAGVLSTHPVGSLAIRTAQGQPGPEYFDQDEEPGVSRVRLDLVQTIGQNLDDLDELYQRRVEVQRLLSGLNADIGPPNPPERQRPITGRSYSAAYSEAYE